MTCEHKFKIINEKIATIKKPLGATARMKVYTIQCEICGDIGFRNVPAADSEK